MIIQWLFENVKYCNKCDHFVVVSMFGYMKKSRDKLQGCCKKCSSIENKKWYNEHLEYALDQKKIWRSQNRDRSKVTDKIWNCEHPLKTWAYSVKSSHKYRGMEVNISNPSLVSLAESSKYCAICGKELDYNYGTKNGKVHPNSPSIDRINNEKSLEINNIWVVCHECNSTKQTRTLNDFIAYCEYVVVHKDEILRRSKHEDC